MAVNAGILNAASIAFTNGGGSPRHQLTISTGTVTVTGDVTQAGSTGSATITFTGAGLLQLGGAFLTNATATLTAGTGTIEYNGSSAQTVGDFTGGESYNNLIINNSAGATLFGTATATGLLTMANGTLNMANTSLTVGGLTGSGNLTHTSGTAATRTLTVNGTISTGAYSGVISNGTATSEGITKTGTGTLILSGTNTYTGVTAINGGVLSVGTIGDGGIAGNLGQASNAAANLVLGNGRLQYTGSTASTDRNFTLTAGTTSTIEITSAGTNLTILGASTNTSGALTKIGAGTLTLSGTNTYTGATTVSAGVLNIQNAQGTGTTAGGVTVANGAALQIQGGITVGAEALSLAGTGIANDGALLNISGNNSWGGTITLGSAGRINSDAGSLTLSGNISGATQNLTVGGAGNISINGVIGTTTGTLTKDGAGIVTLTNTANTYTGITTITTGELRLNPGATSATFASQIVLNSGKLSTTNITSGTTITSSSTLKLDVSSNIDLGSNVHSLNFANSSGVIWNGTSLTINGWMGAAGSSGTAGKIFFGNSTAGLSPAQLSQISFAGFTGTSILLSTGELVPQPFVPVLTITGSTTFGNVCVGAPSVITYTITNVGTEANNVTVTSDDPHFVVSNLSSTTIAASGGTATYQVTFTPTAVQAYTGNITVAADNATSVVDGLSGNGVNDPPTVTAGTATGITLTSATVPGTVTVTGCALTSYGVEYSTSNGFVNGTGTQVAGTNLSGINFSVDLTGLTQSTTYYYHAFATNSPGTTYSTQGTFTTLSPTITVGSISGSPLCALATISVPFTSTGTFSGNTYTAQLSNSAGSFASPVNIGTLVSDGNSGSITATIPGNTGTGTGYLIRVTSSIPAITSTNTSTAFIINPIPTTNGATICQNTASGPLTSLSSSTTCSSTNGTSGPNNAGTGTNVTGIDGTVMDSCKCGNIVSDNNAYATVTSKCKRSK